MDDVLMVEFHVVVRKDNDAGVWFIQSSSVPGLSLEGADPWKLIKRAVETAPELIVLNGQ
jgi:hypothetical protein